MGENKETSASTSLSAPTTVESYSFETFSTVKELVYTWTIKNLAHTHKEVGESIKSPLIETTFEGQTWHWALHYYPNGSIESSENDAPSLVLAQSSVTREHDQRVYLKLCITDGKKEEHVRYEDFFTFSCATNKEVSVLNFATKKQLSDWMINQDLKIVCKMYLNVDCTNSPVNSDPVPKVEETTSAAQRSKEFDDFEKLLVNQKYSDVKLIVGKKQFFAHKNILAVRSNVFAAMFDQDAAAGDVTITDVRAEVMQEALRFVYTGKVNDVEAITGELLTAADKFKLNGLKRICEEVLIGKLNKNSLNEILVLVDRCDVEKLRNATIDFITLHASELSSVESFKNAMKNLSPSLLSVVVEALMLKI